jgi:UDP-glucose 4-epimerase
MAKQRKVLITGGAGFIGSHLAAALLERGDDVYVIDNLTTGSIANIEPFKRNPAFHYWIENVQHEMLMAELVDTCDVICHLAATVGVRLIVKDPVATIENNVKTTEVILRLAAKKQKLVLLASTSEVYGRAKSFPLKEDQDIILGCPQRSRWSYACSKAYDEFLALSYRRKSGLPVIIVRLFNTVGPRQTGAYGMVLPTFVRHALDGTPITVYGSGQQTRCFTHVRDAVTALLGLMETPAAIGEIVNVGSDREVTINGLAELVRQVSRSQSDIVFLPYEEAYEEGFEDMERRIPDVSKLEKLTGVRPSNNLEGLVAEVVEWMKATS